MTKKSKVDCILSHAEQGCNIASEAIPIMVIFSGLSLAACATDRHPSQRHSVGTEMTASSRRQSDQQRGCSRDLLIREEVNRWRHVIQTIDIFNPCQQSVFSNRNIRYFFFPDLLEKREIVVSSGVWWFESRQWLNNWGIDYRREKRKPVQFQKCDQQYMGVMMSIKWNYICEVVSEFMYVFTNLPTKYGMRIFRNFKSDLSCGKKCCNESVSTTSSRLCYNMEWQIEDLL